MIGFQMKHCFYAFPRGIESYSYSNSSVSVDANGNVADLVNADGNSAAHYEYSPYGEIIAATGPAAQNNKFRFSTKYTDDDSGLLYYGLRFYSPTLTRWISRDPIREKGFHRLQSSKLTMEDVLPWQKKKALDRVYRMMRNYSLPQWIRRHLSVVAGIISESDLPSRGLRKLQSISLYLFNENNALQNVDPLGLACGSGSTEMLVPDSVYGFFDFEQACQNHDNCYGNTTDCPSKEECDSQFLADMLSSCGIIDPYCWSAALIYSTAVTTLGGSSFNAARADSCCEPLPSGSPYYPPGFGPGSTDFVPPSDDDEPSFVPIVTIPF